MTKNKIPIILVLLLVSTIVTEADVNVVVDTVYERQLYYELYGKSNITFTLSGTENEMILNIHVFSDTYTNFNSSFPITQNISFNVMFNVNGNMSVEDDVIWANTSFLNMSEYIKLKILRAVLSAKKSALVLDTVLQLFTNSTMMLYPEGVSDVTELINQALEDYNATWVEFEKLVVGGADASGGTRVKAVVDFDVDDNPFVIVPFTYCIVTAGLSGVLNVSGNATYTANESVANIIVSGRLEGNVSKYLACVEEHLGWNLPLRYPFAVNASFETTYSGEKSTTRIHVVAGPFSEVNEEHVVNQVKRILSSLDPVFDALGVDVEPNPPTITATTTPSIPPNEASGGGGSGIGASPASTTSTTGSNTNTFNVTVVTAPEPTITGGGSGTGSGGPDIRVTAIIVAAIIGVVVAAGILVFKRRSK